MRTLMVFAITLLGVAQFQARAYSQQLSPIDKELVQRIGSALVNEADKISQPQIKILADPERGVGLHVPQKVGLLVIPQRDLKESEDLAAKFKSEKGAPLGLLFLYNLSPVVDGKSIEEGKLRTSEITDGDGKSHKITILLMAVRQKSEDDYRLHVYGQGEKPIVDSKFEAGKGPGDLPVAVELKDTNEATRQGKLVITVFGKYQATIHLQG